MVTAAHAKLPRDTRVFWRDRAACADAPPGVFDPAEADDPDQRRDRRNRTYEKSVTAADNFCRHCPVFTECAIEADRDKLSGLWAGVLRTWAGGRYRTVELLVLARGDAA